MCVRDWKQSGWSNKRNSTSLNLKQCWHVVKRGDESTSGASPLLRFALRLSQDHGDNRSEGPQNNHRAFQATDDIWTVHSCHRHSSVQWAYQIRAENSKIQSRHSSSQAQIWNMLLERDCMWNPKTSLIQKCFSRWAFTFPLKNSTIK